MKKTFEFPNTLTTVICTVALMLAAAYGLVVAVAGIKPAVLVLAAILGMFAFALPIEALMRALLIYSVFLSGVLVYFTPLGPNAYWPAAGLGVVLGVRIPIELLSGARERKRSGSSGDGPGRGPIATLSNVVLLVAAAFPVTVLVSSVVGGAPMDQVLLGIKAYFGYWPLMYVLALGMASEKFIAWAWKALFWCSLIQVPFVAFQRIVIMPQRLQGASEFDSIVGTFGGDPFGGGSNATLVLYCLVSLYLAANYYRVGVHRIAAVALVICTSLACIFAGEVKAVIAFLPMGLTAAFWDTLRKKPIRFVYMLVAAGGFALAIIFAYQAMYWSKNQEVTGASESDGMTKSLTYAFNPDQVSVNTGELSRAAVIALWNQDARGDIPRRWLGYGIFASRASETFSMGKAAAKYYPLNINWTTAAALLWDFGLLGMITFFLIPISTIALILKISAHPQLSPETRAQVHVALAIMVIGVPFHFYQNYVYLHPPTQWLYYFAIGYAIHVARGLPEMPSTRRKSVRASSGFRGIAAAHADAHLPATAELSK
ncbi:hypothetical protein [Derxia lacustris]|uniref:hypothetical protein n=1 Tax=Derxia lacustris TaxID=764842 RepID=UPI000A1785C5|nr:hypothetical protein [Derxia lacustris]